VTSWQSEADGAANNELKLRGPGKSGWPGATGGAASRIRRKS